MFLTTYVLSIYPLYARDFVMTEASLVQEANRKSPQLDEIESRLQQAKSQASQVNEEFAWNSTIGYQEDRTKEKAIIAFMPVYSPVQQYGISINRPTQYGLSATLSANLDQRTGSSASGTDYNDLTTLVYKFDVAMDLWKDLFGRLSRRKVENAALGAQIAEFNKDIALNNLNVTIRKIYWAIVSNNEKLKISQALLDQAQAQLADAKKRQANSVADKGEVARYASQVHSRRGSLLYLEYQRELMYKNLRALIPDLNQQELVLGQYDLDTAIVHVLSCTSMIEAQKFTPLKFTKYDEIESLIKKVEKNQTVIDESHNSVDLKLLASYKQTGVASEQINSNLYEGSLSEAQDDMRDNDRSGTSVGVSLSFAFGDAPKNTKEAMVAYNKLKNRAQRQQIRADLDSTHNQVVKSIQLLLEVIQAQKQNSAQLQIRLKDMQKKYNQARISVTTLIQDQDSKMNSDLAIIDSQTTVVNTVLDYLAVFNQTPCAFNR